MSSTETAAKSLNEIAVESRIAAEKSKHRMDMAKDASMVLLLGAVAASFLASAYVTLKGRGEVAGNAKS